MNLTHILNIGYPKCGTTWLWDTLVSNKSIANHSEKENYALIEGTSVVNYCKQYTADVTGNFCPSNIALDRYVIEQLAHLPQMKASIILREPTQLLWSLYTFLKINDIEFVEWCYRMCDTKWFIDPARIVGRWQHSFGDRFKIFWYDDLTQNNQQFYINYCRTMGLDPGPAQMLDKINVTYYKDKMPELDQDLANLLQLKFKELMVYK